MTTIQDFAAARRLCDTLATEIADLHAAGITPSPIRIDLYREYKATVARLKEELRGWAA